MSNNFEVELGDLGEKLGKILLMVIDQNKVDTTAELIRTYIQEFQVKVKDVYDVDSMEKAFKPLVNNIISIVETLGISKEQFRPVRKLCLNEIYKVHDKTLIPTMTK